MVSPSPGPTLDIAVAAADIDVVRFRPLTDKSAVKIKKITIFDLEKKSQYTFDVSRAFHGSFTRTSGSDPQSSFVPSSSFSPSLEFDPTSGFGQC